MTGLRLHLSNRLEALASELVRLVRADPGDPVTPERIIVPHPTIGRWLSLELARGLGIAANLRFEQPAEFAWSIMRGVVPQLSREQPYRPERLRWRIHDLLPGPVEEREEAGARGRPARGSPHAVRSGGETHAWQDAVRGYLGDSDPRKRFELADRLARVYDQCLLYRPDWIREWESGATPHWQARLWQCLVETDGTRRADHWVNALDTFRRHLGDNAPDPFGAVPGGGTPAPESPESRESPRLVRSAVASEPAGAADPAPASAPSFPPPGWPRRASFFAVSALSPSYLELLGEAARGIEIHLFALNPCREYWGDIRSRREIDHRADGADPDTRYYTEGNELLAAWGRAGRDAFDALVEVAGAEWGEHFEEPADSHRLAAVQRDILDLRLASEAARAGSAFAGGRPDHASSPPADDSIGIHVCHSPVREAEVLHDRLLALFDAHRDLEPADVLVLTPDLDVYGPAIEAVFAAAARIPCNVAGGRAVESRTLRAFLDLLSLPASRHGAETVLAPLAAPAVRVRFAIAETDLRAVRDAVRAAGIRWAVDEAHRGEEDLPEIADHTWRQGLRRLLLGYAMADADATVAGLVPCLPGDGGYDRGSMNGELLGRFVSYCEAVFGLRDRLRGRRRPADWGRLLRDVAGDFLADGSEPVRDAAPAADRTLARELAAEVGAVRGLVRDFERESAPSEAAVPLEVVLDVLAARTHEAGRETVRLADGVTVARLGPGRIFPAEVVCAIGMNDGVFPRTPVTPSFDVVAAGRSRRGDRDVRYEDRYAFLEALLAARRSFLVTCSGRGLRDDAPIPPSVLVDELRDHLERRFPGVSFETLHPLQPFSPRYFAPSAADRRIATADSARDGAAGEERLFSYSHGMCEAARTMLAGRAGDESPGRFARAAVPEPDASGRRVDLADLVAFFANPARYFLRERLGVRLELDDLALDDDEPFQLDGLERHRLRTEVWDRMQAGIEPERAAALVHGSGRLPQAGLGRIVHQQARSEVEPLQAVLAPWRAAIDAPPRDVDFEVGDFRVVGTIEHVEHLAAEAANENAPGSLDVGSLDAEPGGSARDRMIWWRIGRLRVRDRIEIRLRQLAWAAAGHGPLEAVVIRFGDGTWKSTGFAPPDEACRQLERWLRAWWRGLSAPLPFFPDTSFEFARSIARAADDGDEAREAAAAKAHDAWFGGAYRRGERLDAYFSLLHDGADPLTAEFENLAIELLVPLAGAQR